MDWCSLPILLLSGAAAGTVGVAEDFMDSGQKPWVRTVGPPTLHTSWFFDLVKIHFKSLTFSFFICPKGT